MSVAEYCNREVVIATLHTSIPAAALLMRQQHVGNLVVVEQRENQTRPIGILTDRDIVIDVIAQHIDPESLTIADVMSTELITVTETDSLFETIQLMQNQGVRRVIVVDAEGNLQGLLTADDAIELIAEAMNDLSKLVKRELKRELTLHP